MKYIKTFESRYKAENIDKKYYVWQIPIPYIGKTKMGIIEIVSIIKGTIKYKTIRQTHGYRDFFTDKKISDNYNTYKISLDYWKRNMYGRLLFDTDNLTDAIDFYDTYEDAKKYNL